MPYDDNFDPNDNPNLIPPGPAEGGYILTPDELFYFQGISPLDYRAVFQGVVDPTTHSLPPAVYDQIRANLQRRLAASGIPAPTRSELIQSGISPDNSSLAGAAYGGGHVPFLPEAATVKLFPATKVPKAWQMRHQSGRGGHIAYLSKTEAAYFSRKKSANAFVRAWNEMISHLGSAADFDQLRLSSLFAAILDAGSGQNGLANGFNPPMNGQ